MICTTVVQEQRVSAIILTCLGCLGVLANLTLMIIIAVKKPLSRWSQAQIDQIITPLRDLDFVYILTINYQLSTLNYIYLGRPRYY